MKPESTTEHRETTPDDTAFPAERDARGRRLPGGVSPNPGGRPRGESVLAEIEKQLEREGADGRPQRVRMIERLVAMAVRGDLKAMDLLLKRVAPERLALEHDMKPSVRLIDYSGKTDHGPEAVAVDGEAIAGGSAVQATVDRVPALGAGDATQRDPSGSEGPREPAEPPHDERMMERPPPPPEEQLRQGIGYIQRPPLSAREAKIEDAIYGPDEPEDDDAGWVEVR